MFKTGRIIFKLSRQKFDTSGKILPLSQPLEIVFSDSTPESSKIEEIPPVIKDKDLITSVSTKIPAMICPMTPKIENPVGKMTENLFVEQPNK